LSLKISQLPATTTLLETDLLPAVASAVTQKITVGDLRAAIGVVVPAGRTSTSKDYIANNAIHNLKDYGAVGDGVANDTAAINACYAATPDGGTMLVPEGAFRHISKLSFNRNVNIIGLGVRSAFVPDLNSTTVDGIVINDTASAGLYRVAIKNFAVLSNKVNACRDAFVCNRVHISEVDVHVKVSSFRYGARLNGCLISKFRIVTSVNVTSADGAIGGYPYPTGLPGSDSVRVERDTTNAISFNNNEVDVKIEGGNNGLWIDDQASQGNNTIKGVIEGTSGGTRALYAKACVGLDIANLHVEANAGGVELDTCSSSSIGGGTQVLSTSGGAYNAAGGRITLTACDRITLGSIYCDNLVVGATCSKISASSAFRYGAHGTGTSIITDTAQRLQGASGQLTGVTASTASGTAVTLLDGSVRGAGFYRVSAFIQNLGSSYHAVADFIFDGTTLSRVAGTNGTLMTTTVSGNNIQATQSSGGNQAIAFSIVFAPLI
jgi:hypothetical protein